MKIDDDRKLEVRPGLLGVLAALMLLAGCTWDFQVRDSMNAVQVRRGEAPHAEVRQNKEGEAAVKAPELPTDVTSRSETVTLTPARPQRLSWLAVGGVSVVLAALIVAWRKRR